MCNVLISVLWSVSVRGNIGLGGETEARHGRSLAERKLTRLLIGC